MAIRSSSSGHIRISLVAFRSSFMPIGAGLKWAVLGRTVGYREYKIPLKPASVGIPIFTNPLTGSHEEEMVEDDDSSDFSGS